MHWRPIETAPKDGAPVLLLSPGDRVDIGSFRVDEGFSGNEEPLWLDNSYDDFSPGYASKPLNPTHWMPLPKPRECLEEEIKPTMELLKDPVSVHVNMLMGYIAKPGLRNYLHVEGLLADFERVVEIASRNEASPEIDRVKQALHP